MWTGSHLKTYVLRMFLEHQKVNHFPRFVLHCTKYIGEPPLALMRPFDMYVSHIVWSACDGLPTLCNELDPETRKVRFEGPRAGVGFLDFGVFLVFRNHVRMLII